jgi:hypothetical protein
LVLLQRMIQHAVISAVVVAAEAAARVVEVAVDETAVRAEGPDRKAQANLAVKEVRDHQEHITMLHVRQAKERLAPKDRPLKVPSQTATETVTGTEIIHQTLSHRAAPKHRLRSNV